MRISRAEAPRVPDRINRQLRAFDRRLRCIFSLRDGVFQVQERMEQSGDWTHVMFWHDGPWNQMRFRPLPETADLLIQGIQKRDVKLHGGDLPALAKKLDAVGAERRAKAALQNHDVMADRMRKYIRYMSNNSDKILRRAEMGGRSLADATQERIDVIRDLGLGG